LRPLMLALLLAARVAAADDAAARAAYDRAFIALDGDDAGLLDARLGDQVVAVRGAQRERITVPDFLDAVGEQQRAGAYRVRLRLKRGLLAVGAILTVAGAALIATDVGLGARITDDVGGPFGGTICVKSSGNRCVEESYTIDDRLTGVGIGIALAGLAGIIVGAAVDPGEVSVEEARDLAARHNRSLWLRLGLPARATLSPIASPTSAGVVFGVRF